MDLRKFIEFNIKSGFIGDVLTGIENSAFYPEDVDIGTLIKILLDLNDADKQQIYSQLQSGGISQTQLEYGILKKRLSFCTDFPIMANNILALLGYDFSKSLTGLLTLPRRLKILVDTFENLKTYSDCKRSMQYIYNILSLESRGVPAFKIKDEFDPSKYSLIDESFTMNSNVGRLAFMNNILAKIDKLISHKNYVLFHKDKHNWKVVLDDLMKNIELNDYVIDSVDELCIILNDFDVGYKGSFIYIFSILYMENFACIPVSMLNSEYVDEHKMHVDYAKKMGLEKYVDYTSSFDRYFKRIYKLTEDELESSSSTKEQTNTQHSLKIVTTTTLYEQLSSITMNLFIQLTKNMAYAQLNQSFFGKSNRVQFIQVITALMACQPRSARLIAPPNTPPIEFTDSQREAIHYFLLTSKLLNDSYTILSKHTASAATRTRTSKRK